MRYKIMSFNQNLIKHNNNNNIIILSCRFVAPLAMLGIQNARSCLCPIRTDVPKLPIEDAVFCGYNLFFYFLKYQTRPRKPVITFSSYTFISVCYITILSRVFTHEFIPNTALLQYILLWFKQTRRILY